MTETMLINELKQLPVEKRFFILKESMSDVPNNELLLSAIKLKSYYEEESNTEFTAIDGDSFYETN
jgi:hypothetical protein